MDGMHNYVYLTESTIQCQESHAFVVSTKLVLVFKNTGDSEAGDGVYKKGGVSAPFLLTSIPSHFGNVIWQMKRQVRSSNSSADDNSGTGKHRYVACLMLF
jgi:hypothetical protein